MSTTFQSRVLTRSVSKRGRKHTHPIGEFLWTLIGSTVYRFADDDSKLCRKSYYWQVGDNSSFLVEPHEQPCEKGRWKRKRAEDFLLLRRHSYQALPATRICATPQLNFSFLPLIPKVLIGIACSELAKNIGIAGTSHSLATFAKPLRPSQSNLE